MFGGWSVRTASSRGVPPPLSQRDPRGTPPDCTGPHMSGLTGRIGRSYARLTMPTPEPTRAGRRGKDVSAIPTFLREGAQPRANRPVGTSPGKATLPRPATPPEPRPEPAPRRLDPAALPMPSLSRRRVVTAAGVLVASLLAISFLRQVGE